MSLRLGFDLDGVLADLNGALVREAVRLFPGVEHHAGAPTRVWRRRPSNPMPPRRRSGRDQPRVAALTRRQERQLWDAVAHRQLLGNARRDRAGHHQAARRDRARPPVGGDLPHQPPAHGRRPRAGPESTLAACAWLRAPVAVRRLDLARQDRAGLELDVVVDDRPENCLDIAIDSKARAILIWRGDQNAVPASARRLGIGGVTPSAPAWICSSTPTTPVPTRPRSSIASSACSA